MRAADPRRLSRSGGRLFSLSRLLMTARARQKRVELDAISELVAQRSVLCGDHGGDVRWVCGPRTTRSYSPDNRKTRKHYLPLRLAVGPYEETCHVCEP